MSEEKNSRIIEILELLLTAESVNNFEELNKTDLPKKYWKMADKNGLSLDIERPLIISETLIKNILEIDGSYEIIEKNPFVKCDEFGKRMNITSLSPAVKWFYKNTGDKHTLCNPALSFLMEKEGIDGVSYSASKSASPDYLNSKEYLEKKIEDLVGDDEELKTARNLIIISSPEEIENTVEDLVCTWRQTEAIKKINIALKNREFLRERKIYEIGKLLFVGPPGTGKTSLALAMAKKLDMPLLEVRLAMVTSQYLGETSKNIDRIFDLARRLSPCILFIDEFDFVAKSRVTDDNGAMKRAVNMLLKNIDTLSFVRNGVLLIGATNHPGILDEAAWRRFDDVVEFPLPDYERRKEILKKITQNLTCLCDYNELASETEGFSGSDLRIMIKESLIAALMRDSYEMNESDIDQGMEIIKGRDIIRQSTST
ncbi:ATP-binding protein [Methanoplanus endosymbiosus]|uniref:ATP-binding protein n=1 Tax=Methanoplanus endosymbiosus TaxID=33865 RepID=A0A9E7THV1_9EURY|nr:ATP-binding protein [Methanoplanus endosymbiosus]UUX93657.1 ATP-binding protein [Methanoplanus endosymbiosus]